MPERRSTPHGDTARKYRRGGGAKVAIGKLMATEGKIDYRAGKTKPEGKEKGGDRAKGGIYGFSQGRRKG